MANEAGSCVLVQVRPQLQASSSSSPMAQMRTATGGVAAGMSANAAAASPLMIAAAAAGQSYQYAALGASQLLAQDSTGIGYPVSTQYRCTSFSAAPCGLRGCKNRAHSVS